MDEGSALTAEVVKELRWTTDLALRANKHTACAICCCLAGLMAPEIHLWLNLTDIRDKDEALLMDAPVSQSGLFFEAVNSVTERCRTVKQNFSN